MQYHLIKHQPELYFDSIHNELNNFLRDMFLPTAFSDPLTVKKNSIWRPAVEIKQNDHEYKVKVQLPGVKKDDIKVDIDNDFMTISAQMHEEKEEHEQQENNEKYHTCEFRYGQYQRTVSFDNPVKSQESHAKYKDGILTITVPKQHVEEKHSTTLEISEE
ncbi:MAG: Hsp20/alpha crystallin family protein [Candidatus Gastranaerophilaceae bacterium]